MARPLVIEASFALSPQVTYIPYCHSIDGIMEHGWIDCELKCKHLNTCKLISSNRTFCAPHCISSDQSLLLSEMCQGLSAQHGPLAGERIRFTSSILPKWARRTKSLDALLPALYLRGISAGDFQEVLTALLGKDAPNLSPAVIARLKGDWEDEYQQWQKRDLSARRYVYVWADGVYLQARMEPQAECMLVLIGATPEGKKELIGFQTGMRESAQSWKELLVDLKARQRSPSGTVRSASGKLSTRPSLRRVTNAAGCTRR